MKELLPRTIIIRQYEADYGRTKTDIVIYPLQWIEVKFRY